MRYRSLTALALIGLLGACNYDVLVVEVESREICISEITADFPGGADGTATATLKREDAGENPEQNQLGVDLPEGFELTEVTLLGIGLEARDGIADFSFVRSISLSMASRDPAVPLPPVELISFESAYQNSTTTASYGDTKYLPSQSRVNLLDYLEADTLELELDVEGDMPDERWSIAMDVCFTFVAEYRKGLSDE
jgi:hypothetical protein